MVKARIRSVEPREKEDGSLSFVVTVDFPEFPAPGESGGAGSRPPVKVWFELKVADYTAWTPTPPITKTPRNFLEYVYIRPTYATLESVYKAMKPLIGLELDW